MYVVIDSRWQRLGPGGFYNFLSASHGAVEVH